MKQPLNPEVVLALTRMGHERLLREGKPVTADNMAAALHEEVREAEHQIMAVLYALEAKRKPRKRKVPQ